MYFLFVLYEFFRFIDITATASNGIESNTAHSIVTIDRSCLRQAVVQIENSHQLQNVGLCQQVQELVISCLRDERNCNISSLKPLENLTVSWNYLKLFCRQIFSRSLLMLYVALVYNYNR